MIIKNAEFLLSVAESSKCPDYGVSEIAIAGKSNVGKSSFINFLTNNGHLAKTSGTPGKTRLLNYFGINNKEFILVDLPGYGYAKVSHEARDNWGRLIEDYFREGKNLRHTILLVDIRHLPTQLDKQMTAYLYHYNQPFTVIATKSDKLSRSEARKNVKAIADELGLGAENILACSARLKTGKDEILKRLEQVLYS